MRISWRNITKNTLYSTINILGLATGMASFIVIILYFNYELSYDKWHVSLSRVSRISMRENDDVKLATPAPLASFLLRSHPEIEAATAIQPWDDYPTLMEADGKKIYQTGLVSVDSGFLHVLPYPLSIGNASTALNKPNAVLISEAVSDKLFGAGSPMGKAVKIYNKFDCIVTGVFKTPGTPSHLNAQVLMRDPNHDKNSYWENYSYQTYIKTKQPVTDEKLENDINGIYYRGRLKNSNQSYKEYKKAGNQIELFNDKVQNIHNFPKHGNSNFATISILLLLATLLLLAGAINFSNLSVAQAMSRAREVGVRKVLGSGNRQLLLQFMGEAFLQCLISLCISMAVIGILIPYLNQYFHLSLSFLRQDNRWQIVSQIGLCLLLVVLVSGLYPSIFLTNFNAAKVLKGDYSRSKNGALFRNGLIIAQFAFSTFFIIGAVVVKSQLNFLSHLDWGFSGEQVLRIQATQKTRDNNFEKAKILLLDLPGVQYVSKTTFVPADREKWVDTSTLKIKYNGKLYRMNSVKVSADYFKTLDIDLLKGRQFNNEYADQNSRTAVLNETAAKLLQVADPVGKTIRFDNCDSVPVQIAGIVKDFQVLGFGNTIQPVVYTIGYNDCMYQSGGAILVKLNGNHLQSTLADITQVWTKIEPDFPLSFTFLKDNFQQLLISHQRLEKIITFFAFVAMLISTMGLFALTAFLSGQRTKEIGIRKVLGASVSNLAALLSKDFILLVFAAIVITIPVGWLALNKWLETFAYRITISWWMFLFAAAIIIVISIITVGVQAIKAALANPVRSLRNIE